MIDSADLKAGAFRMGKILSAEKVGGTEKLIKMRVDFGNEEKQVVAAMAHLYPPDYFVGKIMPFVYDLEPVIFFGIKSEAMILAPNSKGRPVMLLPEGDVPPGTFVF